MCWKLLETCMHASIFSNLNSEKNIKFLLKKIMAPLNMLTMYNLIYLYWIGVNMMKSIKSVIITLIYHFNWKYDWVNKSLPYHKIFIMKHFFWIWTFLIWRRNIHWEESCPRTLLRDKRKHPYVFSHSFKFLS